MEPPYETVVDPSTMIFTMAAYVLHGVFAGTQAALSVYLIVTGSRAFLADSTARTGAALRVAAGLALALPILAGAPFAMSLAGTPK